nr:MAG TPA: hypothetical protein [Caudoviricetes sp.]
MRIIIKFVGFSNKFDLTNAVICGNYIYSST